MVTWPEANIPVFPAGYGPQAADFTDWVTDNFGFLSAGVMLRVQQTTPGGEALSAGFNTLTFNQVLEDPWSGWNPAFWQYNVPITGLYEITVTGMTVAGSNWVSGAVLISGAATIQGNADLCPSGTAGGGICSVIVPLVAGFDFVQGGLSLSTGSTSDTSSPARYPSMEIALVST